MILHANDGSPESLQAARVAVRLAARREPTTLVTLCVGERHVTHRAECSVLVVRQPSHPEFG